MATTRTAMMRSFSTHASALFLVTLASGCVVVDDDDGELRAGDMSAEVAPDQPADFDISVTEALVSRTPDVIDGLEPVGYDEDRAIYVYDSDQDGTPDLTEEIEGTDMHDPRSGPSLDLDSESGPQESAGFPVFTCRPGFQQAGPRLCISQNQQPSRRYRGAILRCRGQLSHVCSYEDLTYLYRRSDLDGYYNPQGRWIGNIVADDEVLCGNRSITFDGDPDWVNFEGTCNKSDTRRFWCCHDDDV